MSDSPIMHFIAGSVLADYCHTIARRINGRDCILNESALDNWVKDKKRWSLMSPYVNNHRAMHLFGVLYLKYAGLVSEGDFEQYVTDMIVNPED